MFVAENFLHSLLDKYSRHTVYTDGDTWYTQACTFLHLKHRLHSPLEKSLIERVMQYFKDRTDLLMIIIHVLLRRGRRIIVI